MGALPDEHPRVERLFTAVRASLPADNAAAFDAELLSILQAPVPDLARLDEFLSAWHRIATRAAADPADWRRMHQAADDLLSGKRQPGRAMAEALADRGIIL